MKRDHLFYRYFEQLPHCFFRLIGRQESAADRYVLDSIEYKETALRLDGVFQPREPDVDPAFIWEAQYYPSNKVYANVMAKIGRFLEHGNPEQDWVAVIIYPNRSMEQKNLKPYRCLIDSDQLHRVFLDELPAAAPDQFEMGVLELIAARPEVALAKAQAMLPRLRESNRPKELQRLLIQFVETIILSQFPSWSRKELERMLQVSDIRETRVFQEALEEGEEKGRKQGLEEAALKFLEIGRPIGEVAKVTGISVARLRKLKKERGMK